MQSITEVVATIATAITITLHFIMDMTIIVATDTHAPTALGTHVNVSAGSVRVEMF